MRTIWNFLKAIWVYVLFTVTGRGKDVWKPLNEELQDANEEYNTALAIESLVDKKFNKIGSSVNKKNCPMWSFNLDTEKIEEVPVIKQESGNYRGFMNPNHPHVWAINYKNAERKFKAQGYEILD